MMNSLSENRLAEQSAHGFANMQAELLIGGLHKKEVSRIEFHSVKCSGPEAGDVNAEMHDSDLLVPSQDDEARSAAEWLQKEAIDARIDSARREARLRAREEWENELVELIAQEKDKILRACEQFDKERSRYFAEVETEVVKLALAIAARVLHREAQLDPLLLSASVRVALEKLAEESGVVVRVPAKDLVAWRGIVEGAWHSDVDLVADEQLEMGECVLVSNVGKIELGVRSQLMEIERGFFDLLQWRPS